MSVENSNVIDAVGISPQDIVILTISDHLDWQEDNEHLLILQNKINAYLEVIESGEIYESYPDAKGRSIQISISFKYLPDEEGADFLEKVQAIVEDLGYGLSYYHLVDN